MLIDDGKILFLKHMKFGNWMPPGGHVDVDETPIDALHREVLEETGYSINIIDSYGTDDLKVDEMVKPIAIMLEHPDYKDGPHEHFDLIYLAAIDKTKDRKPAESSDNMRFFDKNEIETLDTFENCKREAYKAFEAYENFKHKN